MFCNHVVRHTKILTFFFFSNIDKTLNLREKSQKNGGGIPMKRLITQQPKALESLNFVSNDCYDNVL